MVFDKCPFVKYAAPDWYIFCAFKFYRIVLPIVAVPFLFLNTLEYLDLFYGIYGSKFNKVLRIYLTVQLSCSVARAWTAGLKSNKLRHLLEEIDEVYTELYKNSDSYVQDILRSYTHNNKILCRLNFACTCFSVISYNIRPILTKERDHPYPMYIPYIDTLATPYFQMLYVLAVYISYIGCMTYISIGNVYLCLVSFGIIRVKVLQHYLRNLSSTPDMEGENLETCVKNHIEILNYIQKLNDALSYLALFEFVCFSVLICTVLYMLVTGSSLTERFLIIFYLIMNLTQSFEIYYFANKLREESFLLKFAVYENPWYTYPLKIQKYVWMFCMGSERPMEVMIGNIGSMSLETFQTILNVSYSYFNLLRNGEKRH